ncbi:MAG: EutN/CcmL family microcompartment protein [Pseudomonadota bacterium]
MKLGRVTGTVEASVKDASFSGAKLLLCDQIDGSGETQAAALVAVDSCGAGVGDTVLITFNAAARMPSGAAGAATDATIVAVVDRVTMAQSQTVTPASATVAKSAARPATKRAGAKAPRSASSKNSKASNRRKP